MSDVSILREMIKENVLVPIESSDTGKRRLVLREETGNQIYELQIHGLPEDVIAFKADEFPSPDKVFNGSRGENRRADFIVVAHGSKQGQRWIIYIELKGGQFSSANDVIQQLKGAKCVLTYCGAIGQAFWSAPNFLDEASYQQRFVCIKNITLDKRPTRMREHPGSSVHDKPENMLKISHPGRKLQFNKLVDR